MGGVNSNTPAAGRAGGPRRPGFTYQVRVLGGEAGRGLEREQAEAIAEVLRWLAANPTPAASAAAMPVPPASAGEVGEPVGWPYGLEVRAQAVGLVGIGRPVGEVARLVGVHPGTVRRWARQAARRWAQPHSTSDAEDVQCPDAATDPG